MYEHTCENPDCEKKFVTKSKSARFCSDQCRNAAWFKNKNQQKGIVASNEKPSEERSISASFASVNTLPPNAIFIIKELERSRDQIQKQLDAERVSRKEHQQKRYDLEKEIDRIKHDHELEMIKGAKPTGLNGLAENPMIMKILDHVGPGINAMMMRFGKGSTEPLGTGTEGQLEGNQKDQLQQIINWYNHLAPALQQQVYLTIDAFASIPNPQMLDTMLKRIQTLLKNGTSATPIPTPTGTFN